ncbi:MAG TPA: hypothetical protein VGB37_15475 [Candidatus Lokiarchaeia archaeon]
MNKEYFLISKVVINQRSAYKVIDRFVCNGLREAENEFLNRNKKKNSEEFIIVKAERWLS